MLTLATSLHSQGLLDGVGFEVNHFHVPLTSLRLMDTFYHQSHFILNEIPTGIQANLERFTAVGLEVAITELDIRITLPATDEDLQNQATQYAEVVGACVAVSACVGVVSPVPLLRKRADEPYLRRPGVSPTCTRGFRALSLVWELHCCSMMTTTRSPLSLPLFLPSNVSFYLLGSNYSFQSYQQRLG
jgi:hypothetical protein